MHGSNGRLRDKIKLVWVNLELPSEDENYLVKQYTSALLQKQKQSILPISLTGMAKYYR